MEQLDLTTPTVVEALRTVLQEDFEDDLRCNRIELRPTGDGSVAYRLYPRDGSDYIGGIATPA